MLFRKSASSHGPRQEVMLKFVRSTLTSFGMPKQMVEAGMADEADDTLRRKAWEGVADAIRQGAYAPGGRLPPERELAERLNVSRSTLRLALHDLERAGVVVRRPGRGGGTFLA